MSDTVLVKVIAHQRVSYVQTLTFSKADWEDFKKLDEESAGDEITDRLDFGDVHDARDIEDDWEAMVVDDRGKPVKPHDEYGN